jgi:CRISPR-associated protein Csd2
MSVLQNKIDFIALVSVNMANCNGDPLNGNRPRTDYNGMGEISDVCIKRKLRNRMQDLGNPIFVQSEDRCQDGFGSLSERASDTMKGIKDRDAYAKRACETWLDVRTFGQVFAFKSNEKSGISVGIRGPVSIHQAVSLSPVEVQSLQITKSVNGEPGTKKSSDTMGMKHFVHFGLYEIKVQLAEKTGFTEEDAETVKECLRTLFVNDASSARPDGSMEVVKLFWFKHNCKDGQYSSAKVHRSLKVTLKQENILPSCAEDYEIALEPLDGLAVEIMDGL